MLKFKTEKKTRMVPFTMDGTTHQVPEEYEVRTPKMPVDWDRRAVTAAVVLVLILTTIAVVWSTVSIGALLGGGVGIAAAVLFDLAWIINILLEWLARNDEAKRKFPKRMGWGLLAVTMGAIFWHGIDENSVPLAVIGALVSMVAKVLWMGIMRHVHRDVVDPRHKAWIAAERDKASAQIVLAQVRRQSARAEQAAALELLAAERIRQEYMDLAPGAHLSEAVSALSGSASDPLSVPASASIGELTDSRTHDGTVQADTSGYPAVTASRQVNTADNSGSVRQDVRPEPQPVTVAVENEEERVPEQRPASMKKEVLRMVADGLTDVDHIARSVAARFERTPDDPKLLGTVKRYVREAKRPEDQGGQGLYL
ncbi:hypothetical protein [Streptomyces sp. NPDC055036]